MKTRPLNGNLIVKVSEEQNVTATGIILGNTPKAYRRFEVVVPDKDNTVEKGDIVLTPLHSGIDVKLEGREYVLIKVGEILMVE